MFGGVFWGMRGALLGDVWVMFGRCPGDVCGVFGRFLGEASTYNVGWLAWPFSTKPPAWEEICAQSNRRLPFVQVLIFRFVDLSSFENGFRYREIRRLRVQGRVKDFFQ